MTRPQFIATFIVTLIGGLGLGSLLTKWVEGRSERSRWLRDKRHAAYSALAKELLSMGVWNNTTTPGAASALAGEAILLLNDQSVSRRISAFFDDVGQTKQRMAVLAGKLQGYQGTDQTEHRRLAQEYQQANQKEYDRLRTEADVIVAALRREVLR